MSKPSKRKTDRRKKRKAEKQKRVAQSARRKEAISDFPEWHVEPSGAPERFVEAVKDAVKEIALNHRQILDGYERPMAHGSTARFPANIGSIFREASRIGFPLAFGNLRTQAAEQGLPVDVIHGIASFQFANVLYSRLPTNLLDEMSPFHLAFVKHGEPHDRAFTLRFESLESQKTPGGRVYYSSRHPRVELGNERRLVGFSGHAVQRIGERLAYGMTAYEQAYEAFHFVQKCQHFEMVSPEGGDAGAIQKAVNRANEQRDSCLLTFYIEFEAVDGLHLHAQRVLGALAEDCRHLMRVGYCPCTVYETVVAARTLLYPGMRGTPERRLLDHANLSRDVKQRYREQIEHLTYQFACQDDGVELVKWLHHNACPQFIELKPSGAR